MADTITLEIEKRDVLGKAVKRLRNDGVVPGVIHDHGKASTNVQVDYQAFAKVYHSAGKHHPVELTADGKKHTTLIRMVTVDPRYGTYTHVVFNAVRANEKVEATIPVQPRYTEGNDSTPAERAGNIVLAQLQEVAVKALPKDLPDQLFYDAERLAVVGDQMTVADLEVPKGVEVETEPEHVIVTVFEPSALEAANNDAAGDAEDDKQSSSTIDPTDAAVDDGATT